MATINEKTTPTLEVIISVVNFNDSDNSFLLLSQPLDRRHEIQFHSVVWMYTN